MLSLAILFFIFGHAASVEISETYEDGVGPMNLTPQAAGIVAFACVIGLGVVGLLCVFLVAAVCGYRVQANTLYRQLRDVEARKMSNLQSAAEQVDSDLDWPPPPPVDDENDNVQKDDAITRDPVSLQLSVSTEEAELDGDEEVKKALGDMDAAVDGATCSTFSANGVDSDSEKLCGVPTEESTETAQEGTTVEEVTEVTESVSDGVAVKESTDTATGEETTEDGPEGTPREEDEHTAF